MAYYIKRIIAKNLFSWEDLDITFDNETAYSFKGNNGSGKSSIFEVLTWVLFKKTTKKNVKGDFGKIDGKGAIVLSINGDNDLVVRRSTVNPTFVSVNKENVEQEQLEKIIGCSYNVFMSAIMCNQKRVSSFIGEDSDSNKAKIFGDMLGCAVLDDTRKSASDKKNAAELALESVRGSYQSCKDSLEEMENAIDGEDINQDTIKLLKNSLMKKKDILAKKEEKLSKQIAINSAWNIYNKSANQIISSKEYLKNQDAELERYEISCEELNGCEEKFKVFQITIDSCNKTITQVESQISNCQLEITKINNIKSGMKCRLCNSVISDNHMNHMIVERNKISKQIELLTKQVESVKEQLAKAKKSQDSVHLFCLEFRKMKSMIGYLSDSIKARKGTIKELEKSLGNKPSEPEADTAPINEYLLQLVGEISDLNNDIINKEIILDRRDSIKAKLAGLEEELAKKEKIHFIYKWIFDNIPLMKLKFINENKVALEDIINDNLSSMNIPFIVKIETEKQLKSSNAIKEAFSFEIISTRKNLKADKKDLSGGQETCILLATQTAINDISGINLNFEIYDEVYGSLSSDNKENIIKMIKDRSDRKQVFTISHDEEVSNSFDKVVHIIGKDGVSYVKK